jgi:uncharacterized membrane protein
MNRFRAFRHRKERGQTILLVAVVIVTILAMAALAIDVVTLYVARTEMQRAADGAALAAARAFVDSGVTTDPTNTARQTLATDMATTLINTTIQQNSLCTVPPSPRQLAGELQTAVSHPSPNTPSKASLPPHYGEKVSPMCPVQCVTYVSGRSLQANRQKKSHVTRNIQNRAVLSLTWRQNQTLNVLASRPRDLPTEWN